MCGLTHPLTPRETALREICSASAHSCTIRACRVGSPDIKTRTPHHLRRSTQPPIGARPCASALVRDPRAPCGGTEPHLASQVCAAAGRRVPASGAGWAAAPSGRGGVSPRGVRAVLRGPGRRAAGRVGRVPGVALPVPAALLPPQRLGGPADRRHPRAAEGARQSESGDPAPLRRGESAKRCRPVCRTWQGESGTSLGGRLRSGPG